MNILELIILSFGLSTDCFTVSICNGLTFKNKFWNKTIGMSICFTLFHSLVPLIGYLIGKQFEDKISNIDHWIGFLIFVIIGVKMIFDAYFSNSEKNNSKLSIKEMLLLGFATSIDAFVVGITFAFLNTNIYLAMLIIAVVILSMCTLGAIIGNVCGGKYEKKAKLVGGAILILLGIKMLIEHLL